MTACSEQPKRETWATVISISPASAGKFHTDKVRITARSPEGIIGKRLVLKARLDCRVGDTVRASIRGIALTLDGRSCITV